MSVTTKEGNGTHYSYDANGKLNAISDSFGRTLNVAWRDDHAIASISSPEFSVGYQYEQLEDDAGATVRGVQRITGVRIDDTDGVSQGTRQYHYGEGWPGWFYLTGISDENNVRFATYTYDTQGRVSRSEHAGGARRYDFSYPTDTSRIVTDPLGGARTITLTPVGDQLRVTSFKQPGGAGCEPAASAYAYNAKGMLQSRADFKQVKTCFAYDAARRLEISRVDGMPAAAACPAAGAMPATGQRRVSTKWHPDWPMETMVAEPLKITTYIHNGQPDIDGHIALCGDGGTLPDGKPIVVLCKKIESATTDVHGGAGFNAVKTGAARITTYSYNRVGQMLSRTTPGRAGSGGDTTRYEYFTDTTSSHTLGDLSSVTGPAGHIRQFLEYTSSGLATRIIEPNGQRIELSYDARRRLTRRVATAVGAGGQTTHYHYDPAGQLARVDLPDATSITFRYDDAHRLTDITDSAGNTIHYVLDPMGNRVREEVRDATGKLTRQIVQLYDTLNRPRAVTEGDDAIAQTPPSTTRYEYDANGNLTRLIDPLGRATVQRYDTADRLVQRQLPPPAEGAPRPVIAYDYDGRDQITGVIDPRNLPTRYTVDGLSNQTGLASPDTGIATSTFDAAGRHTSARDARGRLTSFDHDALGRITRIAYASGAPSTFEYDTGSAGAIGRLGKMGDESGQTSYAYDGFGRVVGKNVAIGAAGGQRHFSVGYTYGASGPANGKIIGISYPSGNQVSIEYGEDGRASAMSVRKAGNATPVALLSEIAYQPFGPARSWKWGNNDAAIPNPYFREFDPSGRVTRLSLGNVLKGGAVRSITYDAAGRVTKTEHVGSGLPGDPAPGLNQSYGYDDLDRLTHFMGNGTTARYQYDASGNRTQLAYGGQTFVDTINPASNQLQKTTGPLPVKTNVYDAAGNLATDGWITYLYNARGRLQTAQSGALTATYRHNGLDQRAIKIVKQGSSANAPADTTHFMYDESGRLIGEYDANGMLIQETVYLGDLPIAILKNGKTNEPANQGIYYVYSDHINTPRVITDSTNNQIVWRWDLTDPFGASQPIDTVQGQSKFSYNLRFPGQ